MGEWPREATVTIDGVTLTLGQTVALRVAVTSMRFDLQEPSIRADLGPIADGYDARLTEVEALLVRGGR